MATRNYVPRVNGEGSIGTEKKHWGGAFFDKLAVKTLEVIGGGTENDAQPATVGWVREHLKKGLVEALGTIGVTCSVGSAASYISFGRAFGNLLVQWGTVTTRNSVGTYITLPVAYNNYMHHSTMARVLDSPHKMDVWVNNIGGNKIRIEECDAINSDYNIGWLTIGAIQ